MAYTTIDDPTLYFSNTLWSGNGTDDRDIVVDGTGMQPDWVWIKERSSTGYHFTFDSVRGATKNLHTNTTQAESTQANALQTFNSNGFQIGTDGDINNSGDTYVSWSWLAGGSASSNSNGSITSSVSANTTAGFSIVGYTGTGANASVGHGLGVAPDCIIVKRREDAGRGWWVYHKSLGATKAIYLHDTAASFTNDWLQDTAPTSTVFTLDNNGDTNGSSKTHIAYCFAEKQGYSKFGSYTGNGSSDGTFIYTGFKPAFILNKRTTGGAMDWHIWDNKRSSADGENVIDKVVYPNLSNAEDTLTSLDIVSNGIKIRDNRNFLNTSGETYIYMAFAESPFVSSGGIPTTAR